MKNPMYIAIIFWLLAFSNIVSAENNSILTLDLTSGIRAMESNQTIKSLLEPISIKIVKVENGSEETYQKLTITKLEDTILSVPPGIYKIYVQINPSTILEFNNDSIGYEISPQSNVSIQVINTLASDVWAGAPWRIDPGQNIPVTYIIKDTNEYPLYIRQIEVYHDGTPIGSESGDTLVHTRTLEQWFAQNLWYGIDYFSPSSFNDPDENIEIHVKFDIQLESVVHKYFVVRASSHAMPKLPNWYYGDTHYHSSYTDNFCEFGAPIEPTAKTGRAMGLDWVTVTDHSFDLDSSRWSSLVGDSNASSTGEFRVLPAEEVSAYLPGSDATPGLYKYNHYLAYGISSFIPGGEWEDLTFSEYTPSQAVSIVNSQSGGFGYVAHPFASDDFREPWQDYSLPFTGLQVWNGILASSEDINRLQQGIDKWTELLGSGRPVFISGGTDAHGDFSHVDSELWSCNILEKYHGGSNNAFGKVRTAVYATDFSNDGILGSDPLTG